MKIKTVDFCLDVVRYDKLKDCLNKAISVFNESGVDLDQEQLCALNNGFREYRQIVFEKFLSESLKTFGLSREELASRVNVDVANLVYSHATALGSKYFDLIESLKSVGFIRIQTTRIDLTKIFKCSEGKWTFTSGAKKYLEDFCTIKVEPLCVDFYEFVCNNRKDLIKYFGGAIKPNVWSLSKWLKDDQATKQKFAFDFGHICKE